MTEDSANPYFENQFDDVNSEVISHTSYTGKKKQNRVNLIPTLLEIENKLSVFQSLRQTSQLKDETDFSDEAPENMLNDFGSARE